MGLTEGHWFEDEEPELTEDQLEDLLWKYDKISKREYQKGFSDGKLAALAEQEPVRNAWVSVKDRLPEKPGHYLVFRDCDGIYIEFFSPVKGFWYDEDADIIGGQTHWMPLPEPPEGGTLG